jgi:hypothetical protein
MGYMHIDNLYKNQEILMFKECYALEKIHGTSAHISWNKEEQKVGFFSGGEKYENFIILFNQELLKEKFNELGFSKAIVYGEAYGGKQQGMRDTYGDNLKFVVFDIKLGDKWLNVPKAHEFTLALGLEFVDYVRIPTDLEKIDFEKDKGSSQAIRNGMGSTKMREGIVLKPIIEVTKNNGGRIICKHKRDEFRETKKRRKVIDPVDLEVLRNADAIADEWVTLMRLSHILDKMKNPSVKDMREIIISMVEDIKREGNKEIVWNRAVVKAIGKTTAKLTIQYFKNKLKGD